MKNCACLRARACVCKSERKGGEGQGIHLIWNITTTSDSFAVAAVTLIFATGNTIWYLKFVYISM